MLPVAAVNGTFPHGITVTCEILQEAGSWDHGEGSRTGQRVSELRCWPHEGPIRAASVAVTPASLSHWMCLASGRVCSGSHPWLFASDAVAEGPPSEGSLLAVLPADGATVFYEGRSGSLPTTFKCLLISIGKLFTYPSFRYLTEAP